jgi:hypothetical protein
MVSVAGGHKGVETLLTFQTEFGHLLALLRQSSRSYILALEMMTKCTTAGPPLKLLFIF